MKKMLFKFACMMALLMIIGGTSYATDDFAVHTSAEYSSYMLKPVKAGSSIIFWVKVTNNLSVKTIVSINTGAMGSVGNWATVDKSNDTIYSGQTKTFNVTITVPSGTATNNYDFGIALKAVDISGTNKDYSGYMHSIRLIVDNALPFTPTFQTEATSNSVTIYSWNSSDAESDSYTSANSSSGINGIEKYEIALSSKPTQTISASGDNTYTFNGLAANTNYTAKVTAYDLAGNLKSTETTVITAPTAPTLTSAGSTSCTISLSWNAPAGASSYKLYYSNSTLIATTDGTSYTVTGLAAGTSYSFYVKAFNNSGKSSPGSNVVTVSTQAIPTPSFLTTDFSMCSGTKTIQVNDVPDATSYSWTIPAQLTVVGDQTGNTINVQSSYLGSVSIAIKANLACGYPSNEISSSISIGPPSLNTIQASYTSGGSTYWLQQSNCLLDFAYPGMYSGSLDIVDPCTNTITWTKISQSPGTSFVLFSSSNLGKHANITIKPLGSSAVYKMTAANQCGSYTHNYTFVASTPQTCLGTVEMVSVSVSPNPATDNVTVSVADTEKQTNLSDNNSEKQSKEPKSYTLRVYNNYGFPVYTVRMQGLNTTFSTSNLLNGLYIIDVSDGVNSYKKQMIVKH